MSEERLTEDQQNEITMNNLKSAALELSKAALIDPEVMKIWNETFPGICPACFKPHAIKAPTVTKGLCIPCKLIQSKVQKKLATQE